MKTLRFLLATVLLSWVGNAAVMAAPPAPPANVNFVSERGLAFGLLLDGQPLTRPVARQVHVDRLAPGQHWAEFSVPTAYGPPMRFRTPVWLAPGLETSYVLVLRPSGPRLRQVGAVPVPGPAYGGGYYGGAYSAPAPGGPQGGYYGNQPNNQPYPHSQPYPNKAPYGGYPAPGQGGAAPAPGAGYPGAYGTPAPDQGYPGGYGPGTAPDPNAGDYDPNDPTGNYLYPLPAADVQNLVQALRRQSFDDSRLPMVKQALAQNSVLADELAELMSTLSFDKARIELAKFGYGRLSDPQNFYRVYDALRYPSSIREVQQALGLPQN